MREFSRKCQSLSKHPTNVVVMDTDAIVDHFSMSVGRVLGRRQYGVDSLG